MFFKTGRRNDVIYWEKTTCCSCRRKEGIKGYGVLRFTQHLIGNRASACLNTFLKWGTICTPT